MNNIKKTSLNCGVLLLLYFLLRFALQFGADEIGKLFDGIGSTERFISYGLIQTLLLYIVPITAAFFLFKINPKDIFKKYKRPKKISVALGNFPALYGLGMSVNLLTVLVVYILTKIFESYGFDLTKEMNTSGYSIDSISTPLAAIALFTLYAIIAPVFEELLMRGILWDAFKPYGTVFTIFSTGIIFGLIHGNMRQFFYATALGIALGYIRYATDSVLITTILHSFFNSIAAILLITMGVVGNSISDDESELYNFSSSFAEMFFIFVVVLAVAGFIAFIPKYNRIKKLKIKDTRNSEVEVMTEKVKWKNLIFSPTMILMYVLITAWTVYPYVR